VGQELNVPDAAVVLFNTDGVEFGRAQVTGQRFEHHGVRLRVRAATGRAAYPKALALAIALDQECTDRTVNLDGSSYTVQAVSRKSNPVYLGKADGTDRHAYEFSANVTIIVEGE
jgi:hypothetical protein